MIKMLVKNAKNSNENESNTCYKLMIMVFELCDLIVSLVESLNYQSRFAFRAISLNTMKIFDVISLALQ